MRGFAKSKTGKRLQEVQVLAYDVARRLNERYRPVGEYLTLDAYSRDVRAPFRKIAFAFLTEREGHKSQASTALQICEVTTFVPPELLVADATFSAFRRATSKALQHAVAILERDTGWCDEGLVAAVRGLDDERDYFETALGYVSVDARDIAVELRYRVYDAHIEVVAVITPTGGRATEIVVAGTAVGDPLPYMSALFPVAMCRVRNGKAIFLTTKGETLREVDLPM